ncbi:MAG: hypothetical protein KAU21_12260 [Gammaproteobacteria bacterium]|nr:hypothetical protein [Gammaproteobacteria bacterium]
MKEETGVRISEFLDGELSDKELDALLKEIQQSDNKELLQSYSRMGHAIRGESDVYSTIDVSAAVASAIAELPVEHASSTTASTARSTSKVFFASSWFKPVMGAAFASVVAMFTVVLNQSVTNVVDNGAVPAIAQQQVISPENIELNQFARSSESAEMDVAVREELNNYLVNHSRSASGGNYQGMVPYVRAVAYEPGQTK